MDLIYNKIDKSVEDLKFIKNFIKIDYLLNNDFVDRLYKKIAEAYDKIRDFTYMIEQAHHEGEPYNEITSNISEEYPSKYQLI